MDHKTAVADEGTFVRADVEGAVALARALHHLASADPERDGTLTGPAHEKLYGLEREEDSAALWRAVGVHPYENRALVGDEDGAENLRGIETAAVSDVSEKAVAPRAQK
jgi:hypothetical protein